MQDKGRSLVSYLCNCWAWCLCTFLNLYSEDENLCFFFLANCLNCVQNFLPVLSSVSWGNIRKISQAGVESANVRKKKGSVSQLLQPNRYSKVHINYLNLQNRNINYNIYFHQELLKRERKPATWTRVSLQVFTFEIVK